MHGKDNSRPLGRLRIKISWLQGLNDQFFYKRLLVEFRTKQYMAMHGSNFSLVEKLTHHKHALYLTQQT